MNGTLTVTRAPLTIAANNANKTYGAPLPVLTATYTGFVNNETTAVLIRPVSLATTATASSPAGNYPITASGASAANYQISYVNGTLSVDKAVLTVTVNNTNKVYGAPVPAFTAVYSGFVPGDGLGSLISAPVLTSPATADSPAGIYPINAAGGSAANYSLNYVAGTLTVGKALTTGSLASSRNPATPGSQVTFRYSASVTAPGAGTPDGLVTIKVNGSLAGSATLVGGIAQFSTTSLPVGSHLVVAEYGGSPNFQGAAATLSPNQLINTPPVVGPDTIERYPSSGVKVEIAALLSNDFDADGDNIVFVSMSSTSTQGEFFRCREAGSITRRGPATVARIPSLTPLPIIAARRSAAL